MRFHNRPQHQLGSLFVPGEQHTSIRSCLAGRMPDNLQHQLLLLQLQLRSRDSNRIQPPCCTSHKTLDDHRIATKVEVPSVWFDQWVGRAAVRRRVEYMKTSEAVNIRVPGRWQESNRQLLSRIRWVPDESYKGHTMGIPPLSLIPRGAIEGRIHECKAHRHQ